MERVFLSLGSNVGERSANIRRALGALGERGVRVVRESALYGMGRERLVPKGPRIIDLDILLYGERVVSEAGLEIPHPRMAERRFVLVPLAEIAPEVRHPVLGMTAAELLAATRDASEVWPSGEQKG